MEFVTPTITPINRAGVFLDCLALLSFCSETARLIALKNFDHIDLQEMLDILERRLGTVDEQETDFTLARAIAHQLRNYWAVVQLRRAGIARPASEWDQLGK